MDQRQIQFGLISAVALIILGFTLLQAGLADWGLSLVGLMLLGISGASWLHSRSQSTLDMLPAATTAESGAGGQ